MPSNLEIEDDLIVEDFLQRKRSNAQTRRALKILRQIQSNTFEGAISKASRSTSQPLSRRLVSIAKLILNLNIDLNTSNQTFSIKEIQRGATTTAKSMGYQSELQKLNLEILSSNRALSDNAFSKSYAGSQFRNWNKNRYQRQAREITDRIRQGVINGEHTDDILNAISSNQRGSILSREIHHNRNFIQTLSNFMTTQ